MPKYTYYDKANQKTVTVQATAKTWKFLFVVAWIVGILSFLCAADVEGVYLGIGVAGAIYYYAKLGRWWNNL